MQTKKMSLIETLSNTTIGFLISLLTARLVLPQYDCSAAFSATFEITVIFTVVSVVRSYAIRRFFNWCNSWQTNSGSQQERLKKNLSDRDMSKD
jgi:hypothetical protein